MGICILRFGGKAKQTGPKFLHSPWKNIDYGNYFYANVMFHAC